MSQITWQEALLLAGLSYRGGIAHGPLVQPALEQGLGTLAPDWELVWGPSSSHVLGDGLDACAMYVVRHTRRRDEYVVAVRGTNPLSISDWVLGDFNVGRKVAWPFGSGAVSVSTAFGLRWLLSLGGVSHQTATPGVMASLDEIAAHVKLPAVLLAAVHGAAQPLQEHSEALFGPIEQLLQARFSRIVDQGNVPGVVGAALAAIDTDALCAQLTIGGSRGSGLVAFLEQAAAKNPIDVVVTGHSKGGALAPALALWLHQARSVPNGWDAGGKSVVGCHAFAGPTPGDDAFASLLETQLGSRFCRVYNTNDIVTHAWQDEDLQGIPALFQDRTAGLRAAITRVLADLNGIRPPLAYRQPSKAPVVQVPFAGRLDRRRTFAAEFVYQHMDAYLDEAGFNGKVDAITLFLG